MDRKKKTYLVTGIILFIMYLFMILSFIHIRLVMSENDELGVSDGITEGFKDLLIQPFAIFPLPEKTFSIILLVTVVIAFGIFVIVSNAQLRAHYNNKTVQGSARWLKDHELDTYNINCVEPLGKKEIILERNMILAAKMYMSMDSMAISSFNKFKKMRNMNVFVIGGSGAGKSFGLVGPNILQANCSFIVTDPSGGLFKDYGWFLEHNGYRVKCFNLDHMDRGNHYNPFNYIHSDKDIEVLVTQLISNTTPPEKNSGDPFWEKSETALLLALIGYLYHYAPKKYKNFSNVMRLLRAAEVVEEDATAKSPLDLLFEEAEEKDPEGFAIKQYKTFKMGAGKTLKSILISCAVRLQAFDLNDVADLTDTDDIDLDSMGDEKTALFVIIPTGQTTFNFLASMMYTQLFQRLYSYCENTAKYSQLVVDSSGDIVRTFRADSPEDVENARRRAEHFLNKAKTAVIKEDKHAGLYYILSKDNKILRYSNTEEKAQEFLNHLKNGEVRKNKGSRVPIHVRFLLDEFANTGKIPEFSEKVATIRKYEISVTIILQSLQQMKNLYEKEWEGISGNCDNTIYLGGGADTVTTEWFSKLLGKETRDVQGTSINSGNSGGSVSINRQGVELMSLSEMRELPEDECIVLQKSLPAYKGKKYTANIHPNWKLVCDTPDYTFNGQRQSFLYKEYIKAGIDDSEEEKTLLEVEPETKEEKEQREKLNEDERKKADEYKNNKDINRDTVVQQPAELNEDFAEEELKASSEEDLEEVIESLIESDDISDQEFEFEAQSRLSY